MMQGKLTGSFIDKILCIGTTTDMPFTEWQKTYLFNLFLLLAIPTIPYFLVSNIIHERYGLVFLNSLQVLIYTTGLPIVQYLYPTFPFYATGIYMDAGCHFCNGCIDL